MPLRLVNYSNGSKPCHCAVGRQQLSHRRRGRQGSSGWTAKSALQSHRTDDTAAPRGHITPPSHTTLSPRANVNNRNDCVSCTQGARGNMLILCCPWLRSQGVTTADGNLNELTHKLSIMCLGKSARFLSRTKWAWKRDSRLEEKAIMKSSVTDNGTNKSLCCLLQPVFFNPSVGLLWWIIALLTWFHKAVTRLSVPVQHNNKRGSKSEFLTLFRSGRFSSLWHVILERCLSTMQPWTSHKTARGASRLAKFLWKCCHFKESSQFGFYVFIWGSSLFMSHNKSP